MPFHCLEKVRPGSIRWQVQGLIQREQFEREVMRIAGRAGSAVDYLAANILALADAVWLIEPFLHPLGKLKRAARNVPNHPQQNVSGSLISREVWIMQEDGITGGARWRLGPR